MQRGGLVLCKGCLRAGDAPAYAPSPPQADGMRQRCGLIANLAATLARAPTSAAGAVEGLRARLLAEAANAEAAAERLAARGAALAAAALRVEGACAVLGSGASASLRPSDRILVLQLVMGDAAERLRAAGVQDQLLPAASELGPVGTQLLRRVQQASAGGAPASLRASQQGWQEGAAGAGGGYAAGGGRPRPVRQAGWPEPRGPGSMRAVAGASHTLLPTVPASRSTSAASGGRSGGYGASGSMHDQQLHLLDYGTEREEGGSDSGFEESGDSHLLLETATAIFSLGVQDLASLSAMGPLPLLPPSPQAAGGRVGGRAGSRAGGHAGGAVAAGAAQPAATPAADADALHMTVAELLPSMGDAGQRALLSALATIATTTGLNNLPQAPGEAAADGEGATQDGSTGTGSAAPHISGAAAVAAAVGRRCLRRSDAPARQHALEGFWGDEGGGGGKSNQQQHGLAHVVHQATDAAAPLDATVHAASLPVPATESEAINSEAAAGTAAGGGLNPYHDVDTASSKDQAPAAAGQLPGLGVGSKPLPTPFASGGAAPHTERGSC